MLCGWPREASGFVEVKGVALGGLTIGTGSLTVVRSYTAALFGACAGVFGIVVVAVRSELKYSSQSTSTSISKSEMVTEKHSLLRSLSNRARMIPSFLCFASGSAKKMR